MTNEKVIEELVAQRDFLLANTWVKWAPRAKGEGCLVLRNLGEDSFSREERLSDEAALLLLRTLGKTQYDADDPAVTVGEWNDDKCRSAGEAIAVLEEAIRLAKEDTA